MKYIFSREIMKLAVENTSHLLLHFSAKHSFPVKKSTVCQIVRNKKKRGEVFNWANDVKKYYKGFVYTRFTLTWELRACLYRIEHVKGDSRGDNYPQTTHKPATDVPRWVYAIRLFIQAENRSWNKLLQYQAE